MQVAQQLRLQRKEERYRHVTSGEVGSWFLDPAVAPQPIAIHKHLFVSGRPRREVEDSFGHSKTLIRPITADERLGWRRRTSEQSINWVDAASAVVLQSSLSSRPQTSESRSLPRRQQAGWMPPSSSSYAIPVVAEEPRTVRQLKEASRARLSHCLDLPRRSDRDDPVARGSFHKSAPYDVRLAQLKKTRTGAWGGSTTTTTSSDVGTGTLASMTNAAIRAHDWALKLRKPVQQRKNNKGSESTKNLSSSSSATKLAAGG